jgi:ADP-ribose pyrophosphatase
MSRGHRAAGEPFADRGVDVALSAPKLVCRGFRDFQRLQFSLPGEQPMLRQTRDVLRVGQVAAVLPFDPKRNAIVVMRQFRLPAHVANGRGELIEIVAGHVEKGETPAQAARRECIEEIAVKPSRLIKLFSYLPTPGITDEEITLFVGIVDSAKLPPRAGAAREHEMTRPFAVPIDAAIAALADLQMRSGPLVLALHWLALNRGRLHAIVRQRTVRR